LVQNAPLEFSSNLRSRKPEAGQLQQARY
jgi:hypothetical protein